MYESLSIICEYDADENKQSEVFKIKSCPPNVENLHNVKSSVLGLFCVQLI